MPFPSKLSKDDLSPMDGFLLGGYRLVRKGGQVKFNHALWGSDQIAQWEGQYVYIEVTDTWGLSVVARPNGDLHEPIIELSEIIIN